jgi:5'(3')-deoxyribonucleotidase
VKQFSILTDYDDTLSSLVDTWVNYLNNKHNTNVQPEDILSWNIAGYFIGLTQEQVYEPLFKNSFWDNVKPKDDAILYINKLINEGHTFTVVTDSNFKTAEAKMNWLYKHYPMFEKKDIIITSQKYRVSGDILIDDAVHNHQNEIYHKTNKVKILFDAPHNKSYDNEADGVVRVFDWSEIYWYINLISKQRKYQ